MEETKQVEVINIKELMSKLWKRRRSFYLPMAIVFVLSSVYIVSQPRYYATEAKLAPEAESPMAGGTLSSIASSFGFDLGDLQSSDAINPLLYPDLMEDNAFVCKLFDIDITTSDGQLSTTFYNYLDKHQKSPWWSGFTNWVKGLFKKKPKEGGNQGDGFNPYLLSERQNTMLMKIQDNITFSVDKKTGVITINVKDQDPVVCKTMADSVILCLQDFITDYRTNKARTDVKYYTALVDSARTEYEKAYKAHARFADANINMTLTSYSNKLEALENEMQLSYGTYSALTAQLQAARSKVQERTPAFTLLKGAAVPNKPAGPKRMLFVAALMILAFMIKAIWIVREDIHLKF